MNLKITSQISINKLNFEIFRRSSMNSFKEQEAFEEASNAERNTRSKTTAAENIDQIKTKIRTTQKTRRKEDGKRERNPYNIKINLIAGKAEQEKYNNAKSSFPANLIPNPENKVCAEHQNKFCSKESVLERYLITSDNVHIHDILPVDDSRNSFSRVFYLDTAPVGTDVPLCGCQLPYTGEEDHLLPVHRSGQRSRSGKGNTVYNVTSYRMMFDFLLLELTDGCSESGYISAYNRRRRLLCGDLAKECPKTVWLFAVEDFEDALTNDEEEAFTCHKCPSEDSPGDGKDEVHIGDGVSEGTQVDLVPDHIKNYKEPCTGKTYLVFFFGDVHILCDENFASHVIYERTHIITIDYNLFILPFISADSVEVNGIEIHERTIIVQPKVRKILFIMFTENAKIIRSAWV